MQQVGDDRGAVSALVAVLMVALLGSTAIVVDVGAMYFERRQLQNGTDAGALAIAAACAAGEPACAAPMSTAERFVDANAGDGGATPSSPELDLVARTVTVTASEDVSHWFAPILGIDESTVGARASAAWGAPSAGPAVLPITFAACLFDPTFSVGEQLVLYKDNKELDSCAANGPAGGFAWLDTDGGCAALVDTAQPETFGSDPGNDASAFLVACGDVLETLKTSPAMLPVYDDFAGGGSDATYTLTGFVAFQLTGWRFGGNASWNANTTPRIHGDARGVKGYFTEFVTLEDYALGGQDLGASAVSLIPS